MKTEIENKAIRFFKNVLLDGDNPRGSEADENLRWGLRKYTEEMLSFTKDQTEEEKIEDRYFMIHYSCMYENNFAEGVLWLRWDSFPNKEYIQKHVSNEYGHPEKRVIITNIFEFKNKEDYLSFSEEKELV